MRRCSWELLLSTICSCIVIARIRSRLAIRYLSRLRLLSWSWICSRIASCSHRSGSWLSSWCNSWGRLSSSSSNLRCYTWIRNRGSRSTNWISSLSSLEDKNNKPCVKWWTEKWKKSLTLLTWNFCVVFSNLLEI